jgi:hypothetical protein
MAPKKPWDHLPMQELLENPGVEVIAGGGEDELVSQAVRLYHSQDNLL